MQRAIKNLSVLESPRINKASRKGRKSMPDTERHNPFYLLLLLVSLLFVMTVLAVALVPTMEKWQLEQGQATTPSEFRNFLRRDGWQLLLWQAGAIAVLGVLSMALDRLRRLQKERA